MRYCLAILLVSVFTSSPSMGSSTVCAEARNAGLMADPGCNNYCNGPTCNPSIPNFASVIGAVGAVGDLAQQMPNLPYANCVLGATSTLYAFVNGQCAPLSGGIFSIDCFSQFAGLVCAISGCIPNDAAGPMVGYKYALDAVCTSAPIIGSVIQCGAERASCQNAIINARPLPPGVCPSNCRTTTQACTTNGPVSDYDIANSCITAVRNLCPELTGTNIGACNRNCMDNTISNRQGACPITTTTRPTTTTTRVTTTTTRPTTTTTTRATTTTTTTRPTRYLICRSQTGQTCYAPNTGRCYSTCAAGSATNISGMSLCPFQPDSNPCGAAAVWCGGACTTTTRRAVTTTTRITTYLTCRSQSGQTCYGPSGGSCYNTCTQGSTASIAGMSLCPYQPDSNPCGVAATWCGGPCNTTTRPMVTTTRFTAPSTTRFTGPSTTRFTAPSTTRFTTSTSE